MYNHIRVRGPVLFALVFAITAFILSLLVLLAGSTPSFLLDAYIVLYDISSFASSSGNGWYSFYYLSVCHGNWTTDSSSGRTKTNVSCEHKPAGYQISITNYLPAGSMAVGADSYAFRERSPEAYFALWLAGTILTGIAFVLLPMMLPGKIHMNGYLVCILTLANLLLLVGAILTTLDAMELAEDYAQYSSMCLGLTWAAVACIFFTLLGEFVEWNLQRFTPRGERINLSWKSRDMPWIGYSRSTNFRRWHVWA